MRKSENKAAYACTYFFMILVSVVMCHQDVYTISGWARNLARCTFEGNFREFAKYADIGVGIRSDYRIFVNIIGGIWELPLVICERLIGIELDPVVFAIWYKALLIISAILLSLVFRKVLIGSEGYDEDEADTFILTFMNSAFFLIAFLGQGQIDGCALLFLILSFMFVRKGLLVPAGVFFSAALLIKPFGILFYYPLIIFFIWNNRKKLPSVVVSVVILPLINYVAEKKVFWDYRLFPEESKSTYIPRLYDIAIHYNPVFLIFTFLIILTLIYLCLDDRLDYRKCFILSYLAFVDFEIFVEWHPQWLIYSIPFILHICNMILRGNRSVNGDVALIPILAFVAINICFMISIASNYRGVFDAGLVEKGLIGYLKGYVYEGYPLITYIERLYNYIHETAKALITACLIFILGLYLLTIKNEEGESLNSSGEPQTEIQKKTGPTTKKYKEMILVAGTALPTYLYIVASVVLYMKN